MSQGKTEVIYRWEEFNLEVVEALERGKLPLPATQPVLEEDDLYIMAFVSVWEHLVLMYGPHKIQLNISLKEVRTVTFERHISAEERLTFLHGVGWTQKGQNGLETALSNLFELVDIVFPGASIALVLLNSESKNEIKFTPH